MPLTSFWFTSDPSTIGDPRPREPIPADWKIVATFLCSALFIYGAWTKRILNVMGFFELRLHHGEDRWLQSCFIADYNLSSIKFILNMVFFGISGAVLFIQLIVSYLKYKQRRK